MKHILHNPCATLTLSNYRTYLFATLFSLGNVVLPQLCHLLPWGGPTLLPIYFFTLVATCLMGWRVGLLTAVVSPLVNTLWFSMPTMAMLPIVLTKSVALAAIVGCLLRYRRPWLLVAGIVGAQLVGAFAEWALTSQVELAFRHVVMGLPGLAVQSIVGIVILKKLSHL